MKFVRYSGEQQLQNNIMNTVKPNVVTAPDHRYFPPTSLKIFLAGGIQKCVGWQDMVINGMGDRVDINAYYDSLYLLNPRRTIWTEEPGAAERQIEWEFDMLERCDLFTMYFAGGESDQPICMYELGRYIERMKTRFPVSWKKRIIITCDSSYKRLKDVIIQTRLATDDQVQVSVVDGDVDSINVHINSIKEQVQCLYRSENE